MEEEISGTWITSSLVMIVLTVSLSLADLTADLPLGVLGVIFLPETIMMISFSVPES
jgi:hypothetical protein